MLINGDDIHGDGDDNDGNCSNYDNDYHYSNHNHNDNVHYNDNNYNDKNSSYYHDSMAFQKMITTILKIRMNITIFRL